MTLTKNELEVMTVLWLAKKDLTHTEIAELSVNPSWKPSTIHTLLNGLLKKGAIKVENIKLSGKIFGRTFVSIITKEEYIASQAETALVNAENFNLTGVISALLKGKQITRKTHTELKKILDKMEKEIVD